MPGLLARVLNPPERRSQEVQRLDLQNANDWGWLGGSTRTGLPVSDSLMDSSAVFACVRLLATTVANLPLILYRRSADGEGKDRAVDRSEYRLLNDTPNAEMTRVELIEALMVHLVMWGNAFLNIVRNNSGRAIELWILHPDRMTVFRDKETYELRYLYALPNGEQRKLQPRDVCHIRGFGPDGISGYSIRKLAREAIGLGKAEEEFAARRFTNDSTPRGVLQVDSVLTAEQAENLAKQWQAAHGGLENAHRVAVLENGVTWNAMGMSAEDAQALESRRFQVTDIARWFGVPPHMIGDLERSTNNNIEHQGIEFVVYSLGNWLTRIAQRFERDVMNDDPAYVIEFLTLGLLQADHESRSKYYTTMWQIGAMSTDEIRARESMNRIPGGDLHVAQLNMTALSNLASDEAQMQKQVDALVKLIDAGFDAEDAQKFLGIDPPLAHPFPPVKAIGKAKRSEEPVGAPA